MCANVGAFIKKCTIGLVLLTIYAAALVQQHTKPIVHFFIKAPNLVQVYNNTQ